MRSNFDKIPPQIIVVDDEPELVEIYQKSMESFGWVVDTANNGSEADFKITHKEFDAIITDLNMPYIDGIQFVKNIREGQVNRDSLIVVVSGYLSKNVIVKLAQYKVNKIYTKPMKIKEIGDFISETIGCPPPDYANLGKVAPKKPAPPAEKKNKEDDDEMEVAS